MEEEEEQRKHYPLPPSLTPTERQPTGNPTIRPTKLLYRLSREDLLPSGIPSPAPTILQIDNASSVITKTNSELSKIRASSGGGSSPADRTKNGQGLMIGVIIGILLIGVVYFFLGKAKKKNTKDQQSTDVTEDGQRLLKAKMEAGQKKLSKNSDSQAEGEDENDKLMTEGSCDAGIVKSNSYIPGSYVKYIEEKENSHRLLENAKQKIREKNKRTEEQSAKSSIAEHNNSNRIHHVSTTTNASENIPSTTHLRNFPHQDAECEHDGLNYSDEREVVNALLRAVAPNNLDLGSIN